MEMAPPFFVGVIVVHGIAFNKTGYMRGRENGADCRGWIGKYRAGR